MNKKGIVQLSALQIASIIIAIILLIIILTFGGKFLYSLIKSEYKPLTPEQIKPIKIPPTTLTKINQYNTEIDNALSQIKDNSIDKTLIIALIAKASNSDPRFISDCASVGLTHISPETAVIYNIKIFERSKLLEIKDCKNEIEIKSYTEKLKNEIKEKDNEEITKIDERFNTALNIKTGTVFLSELLKRYRFNKEFALAAYYYGPEKFEKSCKENFGSCKTRDKKMTDFVYTILSYDAYLKK